MKATLPSARLAAIGRLIGCLIGGLAAATLASPTHAAAAPGEPMILGVQTHFAYDRTVNAARVIEWVRSARIASTRDEMFWADVEDGNGHYSLRNSAMASRQVWWDRLPEVAPLLILGYGHPRHDGGGQPRSPEAVAAYASHARWLVGETRVRVRLVELWNEWNLKAGAQPGAGAQGGAVDYVRLANAAARAVKAADPGVQVLVGGVGEDHPDWRWTREALAAGLLEGADGVSVHLYNHCDRFNVGADEMARRLDALQALLTRQAGRAVPVYLTEVGWPVHRGDCQVSEADAGTFTLRLLLEASTRPWLKGVWFYESIDSGDEASNREHRFGLLRRDGVERPAGCMVREFGARIAARPIQWLRQGPVTLAVYEEGDRSLVFAWGREGGRNARVRVRSTAPVPLPARSGAAPCAVAGGSLSIEDGRLELKAELSGSRPVVFVVPQPIQLEGVRLD